MEKKLAELLKECNDYDPDTQYMAIRDLVKLVDAEGSNLKPEQLSTILGAILKFLDEPQKEPGKPVVPVNKELQGIAIDSLCKLILKLPAEANRQVCQTMIGKLTDFKTTDDFRGIYATALNSIIKSVGVEHGIQLKDLLADCIRAAVQTTSINHPASNKIQELLIEVADAFITKWPTIVGKLEIARIDFAMLLLNNIIRGTTPSKMNSSMLCLGRYSATLKQDELEKILFGGGLVSYATDCKDDHKKKTALFALKFMLKNANRQQQRFNGELLDFLFKSIRTYKKDKSVEGDTDRLELVCDILEQLLMSLLFMVEHFPKDVKEYITRNNDYQKDVSELVGYSPIGRISYLADRIETEDDDYYEEEDDDEENSGSYSWKVRSVVTSLIGHLARLDSFLVDEFVGLTKLYDRLMETKLEVREAAFEAFNRIVHCVTVEENTKKLDIENIVLYPIRRTRTKFKEIANEFLENLIKKLNELTSKNSVDQKSVLESSRLLLVVCKSFAGTIANDPDLVRILFPLLQRQLKKNKVHEIRANILEAFSYLFIKDIEGLKLQVYLKLMIDSLDVNSEVSLAALKSIDNILEGREAYFGAGSPIIAELIQTINKQLKNSFYKADARKAVIQCASQLFNSFSGYFQPQILNEYLKELHSKLISEPAIKGVLIALTKLNPSIAMSKEVIEILNRILLEISTKFINHQNASIADSAQEAVAKLIEILKLNFSKENAAKLVETSKAMRGIFPRYMESVLHFYPDLFKGYIKQLFSADEIPVHAVSTLLKTGVVTQADCLNLLKTRQKTANINNVVDIVRVLGISEGDFLKDVGDTFWGRVALRCLGASGNKKYFELLRSYSMGNHDPQTNEQASVALGVLSAKHFSEFVPQLVQMLGTADEQHVLNVYIAIKEAVVHSNPDNYVEIDKMFEFLLNEIAAGRISKEAYLHLISECIASWVLLKPLDSERLLNFLYHSEHVGHRYLFATMFRFLEQRVLTDDYIRPKIALLSKTALMLVKLQTDANLNIKTEALKSLTYLTTHVPMSVMMCVNEDLMKSVKDCSLIDEKLIKEQNIVVKILVDYGKPMRKEAFTFLETALRGETKSAFESMYPAVLSAALEGLGTAYLTSDKEREMSLVLQRLVLIKLLTRLDPHVLVAEGHRYRTLLEPRLAYFDSEDKLTVGIVRNIYEINRNLKKEFSVDVEELYQQLLKRNDLKEIIANIDKEFS